jgi:hypothetical protein
VNYWKDRYKDQWAASNKREKLVADMIKRDTGRDVEFVGFGAGSTEYLEGSAASHGHQKGDADLHILDTHIYVEVTGSHKPIEAHRPLWVRPDKIQAAQDAREQGKQVVLVHCAENLDLFRVIPIGSSRFDVKEFHLLTPRIRGSVERFYEIPANHKMIYSWGSFVKFVKSMLLSSKG